MSLTTDFWPVTPAGNGIGYWGYPNGSPPAPQWSQVPNFLNETTTVSVDVLTTYLTPTTGVTCVINGTLPTGWTFDGTTLAYNGTSVNATPTTLSFTATLTSSGNSSNSNTFTVQGAGSGSSDPYPPTVPTGVNASSISTTGATLGGFQSSDPNPPGYTWGGMQQYNVTVTPGVGTQVVSSGGTGNKPTFALTDIGTQTSTSSQTGSSITLTTVAVDPAFPTQDGLAFVNQQLTGTAWVMSCKIAAFTPANIYSNIGIQARTSLTANSAFVGVLCTSFAGGQGVQSYYRASAGSDSITLATNANTSAVWLFIVRSANTFTFYSSPDGNTLQSLSTITIALGSTLYIGVTGNTNDGVAITGTLQQVNLQTLPSWSLRLATLTQGTTYNVTVTAQDTDTNVSAASTAYVFQTLGASSGNFKFNPGHYIELDPNNSSNWVSRIQNAKAMGFVGVFIILNWRQLDFGNNTYTSGVQGINGGGFAFVDWLLSECTQNGIQCGIGYEDRSFVAQSYSGTPTASTFGALPDYFNTNGSGGGRGFNYAPSNAPWDSELMSIAQVDQSFVTAAALAMQNAYGQRYDSNNNFEMWRGPETAVAGPSGINDGNYANQIASYLGSVRSSGFKRTLVGVSPNYFGSNSQMQQVFTAYRANQCGGLGPDNTPGKTDFTSNMVHTGYIGGTDYRNVIPCVSEAQYPDVTGQWGFFTPQQYYAFAFGTNLSLGQGTQPNYMLWFDNTTGTGISIAQVSAAIPSMPLNTTMPSVYT